MPSFDELVVKTVWFDWDHVFFLQIRFAAFLRMSREAFDARNVK